MLWYLVPIVVVAAWLLLRGGASRKDLEEAKRLVDGGALLVDVRTASEYASGHIDGAKNLPVQELEQRRSELPEAGAPIVVYCRSGSRSARAKRVLEGWGFEQVVDAGPMHAWPR